VRGIVAIFAQPEPIPFVFGEFGDGSLSTPEELAAMDEAARVASAESIEATCLANGGVWMPGDAGGLSRSDLAESLLRRMR
jgi:hypothetical protein